MILGILKENRLNLFMLTLLYIGLSIEAVGPNYLDPSLKSIFRFIIMGIVVIYFSIVILKKRNFEYILPANKMSYMLLMLWFMFGISIGMSDVLTMRLPTGGIGYSFMIPLIFFILIPMALDNPLLSMIKALFYSSFIYIILTLLIEPTNAGNIAYMGITANYNNMGLLAFEASLSVGILLFVANAENKLISFKSLFYIFSFIISVIVLMRTQSRTAFLGLIVGAFVALILNIMNKSISKKQLLLLGAGALIIYVFYFHDYFVANILSKFATRGTADVLSGRGDIWMQVFNESTLLGHGGSYFNNHVGIAAHNVIIQILGEHGIISSILLLLFILGALLVAFGYFFIQKNKMINFIPFAYLCGFFIIIMSESVFGVITKTPTMMFYSFSGVLIFENNYKRYGAGLINAENINYHSNL